MPNAETKIDGLCPDNLAAVREAFAANFRDRDELGAAVAVSVDGELVIDLWGGLADEGGRPWTKDTIVNVYSCTKAATATCAHILVDRGLLDLDAPVATYWPEFAAAGKESLPVRYLLSHRAGLMGPRRQLKPADLFDWKTVTEALAEAEPWFEPGTMAAYHGISFGFLVGEVIRRISGQTVGAFLRANVTEPLGIANDMYVGVPAEEQHRCATVTYASGVLMSEDELAEMQRNFLVPIHPSLESWLRIPSPNDNNTAEWRSAELPATGGHMSARGLATMYGALANGGRFGDTQLVSAEAVERMRTSQGDDGDLLLGATLGPAFTWLSGFMANVGVAGPNPRAFGHTGAGGSYGFADPEGRVSFAYVMNKMSMAMGADERVATLTKALYDSLG